jgi:hypothetical protein
VQARGVISTYLIPFASAITGGSAGKESAVFNMGEPDRSCLNLLRSDELSMSTSTPDQKSNGGNGAVSQTGGCADRTGAGAAVHAMKLTIKSICH